MPNIKSAEKRVQIGKVRNARNKADRSELKTVLKKFDAAVAEGSRDKAESAYKVAVKAVDKAAGKGLIHKNKANRTKSQLAGKLNTLKAE